MPHGSPLDIVADMDTPVAAYRKLYPVNPSFLLEFLLDSGEGGERIGRYRVMGLGEGPSLRLDWALARQQGWQALERLDDLESAWRGLFGGTVGYIDPRPDGRAVLDMAEEGL